jgi:hypothetical protein
MEGPEQQNIEYTEYMPGSRHFNDFGQHLGADRVSGFLVAAALDMRSPQAARDFYIDKLAFSSGRRLEPESKNIPTHWLQLPGFSSQSIAFTTHTSDTAFHMIFAVENLKQTAARLTSLGIPFSKTKELTIQDPDGNILAFIIPEPFIPVYH